MIACNRISNWLFFINDKILAVVEKARKDAKASIERLGMADLLKKHPKWDCARNSQ